MGFNSGFKGLNIMNVTRWAESGGHVNTLERFHTHINTKYDNQINAKNTVWNNILFNAIMMCDVSQGL